MKTREDSLELVPKNSICAEIGVFEGAFSEIILNVISPKEFILVDLFEGEMCSGDKNGNNIKYIKLEDSYKNLVQKYINTPTVKLYKGKSSSFFETLPDNYLDFVYIDGDHSYEGCKSDLAFAKTKIKTGGIIAGHDYCDMFTGVMDAVDEFAAKFNLKLNLTTEDRCTSYYFLNI
jgi:hypothetical protein